MLLFLQILPPIGQYYCILFHLTHYQASCQHRDHLIDLNSHMGLIDRMRRSMKAVRLLLFGVSSILQTLRILRLSLSLSLHLNLTLSMQLSFRPTLLPSLFSVIPSASHVLLQTFSYSLHKSCKAEFHELLALPCSFSVSFSTHFL